MAQHGEDFMECAFTLAREALANGEVPVGCVFVYENHVVASGRNTVNATKNATRHAEINALDALFAWSKENALHCTHILSASTLYVTVEPCVMCAEVLGHLKLGSLVFGCSNDRFGGCGSVVDVLEYYKELKVVKGLRTADAVNLLKEFYKGENLNAPEAKVKRKT